MRTNKRIRTVLYGDERLSAAELEVIHTPALQRLYGLKQLGLADRVFIDASHTRIHHVVGVLEEVDKLVKAIVVNLRRSDRVFLYGTPAAQKSIRTGELAQFVSSRRAVIRFIGLLHDLTHAPFGHTVEDEIGLVDSKHDDPNRQADAFYRLVCQLVAWFSLESQDAVGDTPPDLAIPAELRPFLAQCPTGPLPSVDSIVPVVTELLKGYRNASAKRLPPGDIAELIAHLDCAMTALLHLEALHKTTLRAADLPNESEYSFQKLIRTALRQSAYQQLLRKFDFQPHRDAFMLDIVGNTVCADLLDYAKRDSRNAGLRLDFDSDRIAENFTLAPIDAAQYEMNHEHLEEGAGRRCPEEIQDPFEGLCLRAAISLVSHKYRTDIPSELMNLLNVRYYIYERVVFHPTKCAAGSMLGTALQLLGWRQLDNGNRATLPGYLKFVGDEVFLYEVGGALEKAIERISKLGLTDDHIFSEMELREPPSSSEATSRLTSDILELRVGDSVSRARKEYRAAQLLLERLTARRYLRAVFRALPNSAEPRLQAGADALADRFRKPDVRYAAERLIERRAELPLGTVTIHCPTRKTARKIANVFLTKPEIVDGTPIDPVSKLKHIASLDKEIFAEHERAVHAVQDMYNSMWRMTVYVAPEQLGNHDRIKRITETAGSVIFETMDTHGLYKDKGFVWRNDTNLAIELDQKIDPRGIGTVDGYELGPAGETLGRICDEIVDSAEFPVPAELFGSPNAVSPGLRARIKEALAKAISESIGGRLEAPATAASTEQESAEDRRGKTRIEKVTLVLRTYLIKPKKGTVEAFEATYGSKVDGLSNEQFEDLHSRLALGAENSSSFKHYDPEHQESSKVREFQELLDGLLREVGSQPQGVVSEDAN